MHTAVAHNQRLAGTWALDQLQTANDLNPGTITRITTDAALDFDKLTGYSARVEWRTLEPTRDNYDFSILEMAYDRARAHDLPLAIRFMAGFRCPTYLYTQDGCRFFSAFDRHSGVGGIAPTTAGTVNVGVTTTALTNTTTPETVNVTETSVVPEVPFTIQIGSEYIKVPTRTLVSGSTYRYGTAGANALVRASTVGTDTNPIAAHGTGQNVLIGGRIPDPCDIDGTPNTTYGDRWEALVSNLADWCRSKGGNVPFLHVAWYGLYWSEIYNDYPLRPGDGRAGYDTLVGGQSQECITAHASLITRASGYTDTDLASELSFSGHGANGAILTQLQARIRSLYPDYTGEFYVQANNITAGTVTGWPVGLSKGLQMLSSYEGLTEAQWENVYRDILISPERGDYIEIYIIGQGNLSDFTDANSKYLQREVYRFWRLCNNTNAPMLLPIGS